MHKVGAAVTHSLCRGRGEKPVMRFFFDVFVPPPGSGTSTDGAACSAPVRVRTWTQLRSVALSAAPPFACACRSMWSAGEVTGAAAVVINERKLKDCAAPPPRLLQELRLGEGVRTHQQGIHALEAESAFEVRRRWH